MTSWFFVLGVVAALVALLALAGAKPASGRSVAHTRLMTGARVVLVLTAVILALLAWQYWA